MSIVNVDAYDRAYEIVSLWDGCELIPRMFRNFQRDVVDNWHSTTATGYGGLTLSEFLDRSGLHEEFIKCMFIATGKTIDGVPVYEASVLVR